MFRSKWILATLAAAALCVVAAAARPALPAPASASPGTTWEYKVLLRCEAIQDMIMHPTPGAALTVKSTEAQANAFELPVAIGRAQEAKLNELGAQGWELVSVSEAEFILRRAKLQSNAR